VKGLFVELEFSDEFSGRPEVFPKSERKGSEPVEPFGSFESETNRESNRE
jgi:hypothetical protein